MEINQVRELLNVQTITKSMLKKGLYHPHKNLIIKFDDCLAVRMNTGRFFVCDDNPKTRFLLSKGEWLEGSTPYTQTNGRTITFIEALTPNKIRKLVTSNEFDMRDRNIITAPLLKCELCDFQTGEKVILKDHIASVHQNEKRYSCPECEYESYFIHHVNKHIAAVHQQIKRYKCPKCDYENYFKKAIEQHIETHENDGKRGSKGERKVMDILKNLGIYYIYDKPYCDLRGTKNPIRFDFRIPLAKGHNLFIEVDGEHHRRPVAYGGMKHYDEAIRHHNSTVLHDGIKNQFIIERGDSILRLPDNKINTFVERIDSFILRNSKLLIPGSKDRKQNTQELIMSNISIDEKMEFNL